MVGWREEKIIKNCASTISVASEVTIVNSLAETG